MRPGPLTVDARRYGFNAVLDIQEAVNGEALRQDRPSIDLINTEEQQRILHLIADNTWRAVLGRRRNTRRCPHGSGAG